MNFEEFIAHLRGGSFFDRIDRSEFDQRAKLQNWLRFVKTDAIDDWVRSGSSGLIANRKQDVELMSLVLERRLVDLNTRRDPSSLRSFWKWLVEDDWPELVDLWNRHAPASTMNDPCPLHQEAAYGKLLQEAAQELRQIGELQWGTTLLKRLAEERLPDRALRPQVRIVFALDEIPNPPEELRRAFVVNFRLLSPTDNVDQICELPEVFDESFWRVFGRVNRRIDRHARQLEHDAEFLDPGTLSDTSGTFALWLAQWLAARPRFDQDLYTSLPPWVVITSNLNHRTDQAVKVGGLAAKVEVLAEEGVRYVIVGDEQETDLVQPGDLPKLDICPAHPDLHGLRFSGSVGQLANQLQHLKLLRRADTKDLQGTHLKATDSEKSARLRRLNRFRFVEFNLENDFVSPVYAYKILQDAISSLSEGRGYIHLTGKAGMGKSTLVQSIRPGFNKPEEQPDAPTGPVIGHLVLRGTAENPAKFIEEILRDAESHVDRTLDEELKEEFKSKLDQLRVSIFSRQSPRPIQEGIAEIISIVRKYAVDSVSVIMAIDGLDELTLRDSDELTMRIHELLPSPEQLDEGCFVLLTSRPTLRERVQEAVNKRKIELTLFTHCELSLNDAGYESIVREYISRKLGSAAEPHIPAILQKAERRFIWVRLLVELLQLSRTDFSKTSPGDLELPNIGQMLPQYMKLLGNRVAAIDTNVVIWLKPALLVIAAAFEPITRRHLHAWLTDLAPVWNDEASFHLDAALIAIQPLLYENRASHSDGSAYNIAHREIMDWLAENKELDWNIRAEGHQRIIDSGQHSELPAELMSKGSLEYYELLYLAKHLIAVNQIHLARIQFLDRQVAAHNGWEEYCARQMDFSEIEKLNTTNIEIVQILRNTIAAEHDSKTDLLGLLLFEMAYYIHRGQARHRAIKFPNALSDLNHAIGITEDFIAANSQSFILETMPALFVNLAVGYSMRAKAISLSEGAIAITDHNKALSLLEKVISIETLDEHLRQHACKLWAIQMIDREECSYLHTDGTLASRDDLLKIIDWYKSRDSGDALTPEFRLELARSYYFCSVAGRRRKEPKPSTMEQLEIAISIYERLIADCENRPVDPEHWQRLVRCSAAALIVRCDMRIPDYAGCLSDLDIGISRLTSLSKSLRDENCYLHLQVCWELGELHNQRANIHLLLNEKDAALLRDYNHSVDSFVRATEVAAALEEKRFLAEAFERLSQQLHVRADKLARIGSFCAAITDLRRAIEILPQNSKDVEIHLSLAAAHEAYGWEFQCNGNLQRAYDEYSLAAGQATHVLKERPKISILRLNRNLGRSYSLSCDGGLQVGQKPSKLVEECLVRIAFVFKQVGRAIFTRELLQECNWWINFCKLNLLVVPSRQVEEWGPILDCILEKTGIAILFIDSPSVLKVSVISRSQVKFLRSQKTGRNSPCLCGSGLKYKKCCMRKST